MSYTLIGGFLLVFNLIAYLVVYADKQRAVNRKRRFRERTLWQLSIFGGALGVYLAMQQFRHKTKHRSFMIGVPACICLNALIYGGLIYLFI